ncbi:type IIL restriction-modification enzyme MmeI [Catalinimonas locisalis]
MKSDYRYSNTLVYDNFPWPKLLSERHALHAGYYNRAQGDLV